MDCDLLHDIRDLPTDDQFLILLHKKIMNKTGSARRRSKKYYKDIYKKTGIIPKPLILAAKGVFEGRKCSGRKQVLEGAVKKRFIEMVKASTDISDDRFIFVTRRARTIKNYHRWLEEEFNQPISLAALRRFVKKTGLKKDLSKPDYGEIEIVKHSFKSESVFGLLQMDGCQMSYIKIRDESGQWRKPVAIEIYDTSSRNMLTLDVFFSESSKNGVCLFSKFLLGNEFPPQRIKFRPDRAKGFLNLKRVINELNLRYSKPDGFYMQADFSRVSTPKDKAHLESSHRSLHNFEMRIINAFQDRIESTRPGYLFKYGRKEKITVTYLDIGLQDLKERNILEVYRREHNNSKHYFSEEGRTVRWVPEQKLADYLSRFDTILIPSNIVQDLMKYGYKKVKVSVSKQGRITYGNRKYYVVKGVEKFSRHKSTKVMVSIVEYSKLLIFEPGENGIYIGEALMQEPFSKPIESKIEKNDVEKIAHFLESQNMIVDFKTLIEQYAQGVTLQEAIAIYNANKRRYSKYLTRLNQPFKSKGKALFNAFIMDCERRRYRTVVAPYADCKEELI